MRRIGLLVLTVLLLLPFLTTPSHAQWAASYWGSQIYKIHQTADGGFITSIGEEAGVRLQKLDALGIAENAIAWRKADGKRTPVRYVG